MSITPARLMARAWLASWWPFRSQARALAVEYAAAKDQFPLMVADLARFCCASDTTYDSENPHQSDVNQGKREAWLHFQEMAHLEPEDLRHLQERTEDNG
jgi:hypothetical protein